MVWTIATALRAELARPDPDIRRLVTIGIDETTSFSFVDGETNLFGYPAVVADVDDIAAEIDPFTREVSIGEMSVKFGHAGGVILRLIRNHYLVGKQMLIQLGTSFNQEGDFATIWNGTISKVEVADSGETTISAVDGFGYLRTAEITGGWIGMHPLEIIRDIMANEATPNAPDSVLANVPTELWDTSTFDYTLLTSISHWNLSRWEGGFKNMSVVDEQPEGQPRGAYYILGGAFPEEQRPPPSPRMVFEATSDSTLLQPTNAWALVQELLICLNSAVTIDEDGRMVFARYSPSASAVRHWTRDRIKSWKQPEVAADLANRLDINFGGSSKTYQSGGATGAAPGSRTYRIEDAASQALHTYPGAGDRSYSKQLEFGWARAITTLSGAPGGGSTTLTIPGASMVGFSGARWRSGFGRPLLSTVRGYLATTDVTVTGNVAVATLPASHWFQVGDYITSGGHTVPLASTPVAVTARTSTTIAFPLTSADGSKGAGVIFPEQHPADQLSAGVREAYFMLFLTQGNTEQVEIVRATAAVETPGTTVEATPQHVVGTIDRYTVPSSMDFTVARAQLGTLAIDVSSGAAVAVIDATIPIAMLMDRIARTTHGAPEIEIETPISEVDVQLADFVSHDHPSYVARSSPAVGADSSVVLEVVSKKIKRNSIAWKLRWAYQTAVVNPTVTGAVQAGPIPSGGLKPPPPYYSVRIAPTSPRYLEANNNAAINFTNEFTASAWIWMPALPGSESAIFGRFMANQRTWRATVTTAGELRLYIADDLVTDAGANFVQTSGAGLVAETWYHVAFVYAGGTGTPVVIYVDEVEMTIATTGAIDVSLGAGTGMFQIGADGNGAMIFSDLHIAMPSLFSRALGAEEVAGLAVNDSPAWVCPPNHVAWWWFRKTFQDQRSGVHLRMAGANTSNPEFSVFYPPFP